MIIKGLKADLEVKRKEYSDFELQKSKEIKGFLSNIENLHTTKLNREVEIMKREEEMNKKMEAMAGKEIEAKGAMEYFHKKYVSGLEDLK